MMPRSSVPLPDTRLEMRYRLVIFDFDGTLADSMHWFLRVLDDAAVRYRFGRVAAGDLERLRGLGARELMRHLGIAPWKSPLIAGYMRRRLAEDTSLALFPGISGVLRDLADGGVALAVVTSNSESTVRRVLGSENVARIRGFQCGASVFGKARRFRRVLRDTGIPAHQALCVGDEIRDAEAARVAGIPFGAALWGYTTEAGLRGQDPAHLFHTPDDILAAVTGARR
jgi:phosphoglycolate phosphatase